MKIITTTIRHKQNEMQLAEFLEACKDPRLAKRYQPDRLLKTGFSRTVIEENRAQIETIVQVEKD